MSSATSPTSSGGKFDPLVKAPVSEKARFVEIGHDVGIDSNGLERLDLLFEISACEALVFHQFLDRRPIETGRTS